MEETLFDRLGGRDGIARIAERVMANHFANPRIRTRFEHSEQSLEKLTIHAIELFGTGPTDIETYQARPLPDAHAGMNIDEAEFVYALDDIMAALESENVGELEQAEVLRMLYGSSLPSSRLTSVPEYLAIFNASDSCSRNLSSWGVKSISFRKLRLRRLNTAVTSRVGRQRGAGGHRDRTSGGARQPHPRWDGSPHPRG
jgi:hemoglobin